MPKNNKKYDKFYSHCGFHLLNIDTKPFKDGTPFIGLTIYEHKSGNTGKPFKNPKELGTVTLIGNEAIKFIERIKNI